MGGIGRDSLRLKEYNQGMAYAIQNIISVKAMEQCSLGAGFLLRSVIDHMKAELERNALSVDSVDTRIRPWPIQEGESSAAGYDKLVPRYGIQLILTSRP